ncbi:hypothetical protein J1C56_02295 [Aminobacter anthyllidis]|uniref:Holin of 3TMs, for gene-transfer release n=1 Tax=Aminobacter anthyllidis TaxID=1035067 RepID=A0A9X1A7B3_9HYPH|nr:hypothetical protein [Aminobacter anthyllidis]MBT1154415.1 hypothetical protein [Aminobacter anthyllidis]
MFKTILGWLTGGTLDRLLDTIEHRMDDETKKEEIKAEVTRTYINAKTNLMVGRTWWFQLFFVVPLGFHWACLNFVSAVPQWGWTVHPLPAPFDEWAGEILLAVFAIDGAKAVIGRLKK